MHARKTDAHTTEKKQVLLEWIGSYYFLSFNVEEMKSQVKGKSCRYKLAFMQTMDDQQQYCHLASCEYDLCKNFTFYKLNVTS